MAKYLDENPNSIFAASYKIDAFNTAIANGAEIIVCHGFAFGNALAEVVLANPDVKFVFIDGWNRRVNAQIFVSTLLIVLSFVLVLLS